MKKIFLLLLILSFLKFSNAQMVITGIADGPLSGGTPKVIELYPYEDIADLSIYGVESANNGGAASAPELVLSGSAAAGQFIYIASEAPNFNAFFGFDPDYVNSVANNNGDDVVILYKNGSIVDVVGEIGVDGTGTGWESLDGWAYRVSDTGPDGATFIPGSWTFSGINMLEGGTTNATTNSPFPLGTYTHGGGVPVTVAAPTFSPAAGSYTTVLNIEISSATAGASIYYTTNGETPTNASTLYTVPISVTETTTIKAIAYNGDANSSVSTALFKLEISSQDALLPYTQHFTTDEGNFSIDSKLGDQVWKWGNFDGGCMVMSGYASGDNDNQDWLISPKFDFSNYTNLQLKFREAINYMTSYNDLQVMISTDYNGDAATPVTWTELTVNGRSTGDNWNFTDVTPVDLSAYEGENTVTIAFKYTSTTAGSSTWEISSVSVTGTEAAVQEPSNHVTNFSATTGMVTETSIQLAWNENDGTVKATGFLIKASTGTIVPPVDGTDVADDTDLTDGSGNVKVLHGTPTYTFNNCAPGTTYHFAIYPYAGSNGAIQYKTENAPTTQATTISAAPANPTNFTAAVVSTSQINLNWQKNATNPQVMVAVNLYSEVLGTPAEGATYAVNANLPGGGQVIYTGEAENFNHTNLESGSYYHYKIWTVSANQKYSSGVSAFAATLAPEPTNHVANFSIGTVGLNTIPLLWSNVAGGNAPDGYLLLINDTQANLTVPVDGTDISGDTNIDDGNGAVKVENDVVTYTWDGLNSGTTYYLSIYPYVNSGNFIDYKTDNAPTLSGSTVAGVSTPTFTPVAGSYADSTLVSITCKTVGATIYYTLDGTTPGAGSTLYQGAFKIYESATVKAIALLNAETSSVAEAAYEITITPFLVALPVFTPAAGTYPDSVEVSISCATVGATIHYTIDGTVPGVNSMTYSAPVKLTTSGVLKAIAVFGNFSSEIAQAAYTITVTPIVVATPVILPVSGEFTESVEITISSATAGAVIYYTTNGTTPTNTSTLYSAGFVITETTTVKAIAYLKGFSSSVAVANYTLKAPVVPIEVNTLAELRNGLTDGTLYNFKGNAMVTFAMDFRQQKFIQDETAAVLIDDNQKNITSSFQIGNGITDITGTLYDYNGLLEFMPVENATKLSNPGFSIQPQIINIDDFKTNFEQYESELIKVEEVTIGDVTLANGTDYMMTNGNQQSIVLRTHFYNMDYIGTSISKTWMNVTGIALWHGNEGKIVPRNNNDIELTTSANTIWSNINIYSSGKIIFIDQPENNHQIDIYSFDGKRIKTIHSQEAKLAIPMDKTGLYLVVLKSDQKVVKVQKVAIQ